MNIKLLVILPPIWSLLLDFRAKKINIELQLILQQLRSPYFHTEIWNCNWSFCYTVCFIYSHYVKWIAENKTNWTIPKQILSTSQILPDISSKFFWSLSNYWNLNFHPSSKGYKKKFVHGMLFKKCEHCLV